MLGLQDHVATTRFVHGCWEIGFTSYVGAAILFIPWNWISTAFNQKYKQWGDDPWWPNVSQPKQAMAFDYREEKAEAELRGSSEDMRRSPHWPSPSLLQGKEEPMTHVDRPWENPFAFEEWGLTHSFIVLWETHLYLEEGSPGKMESPSPLARLADA